MSNQNKSAPAEEDGETFVQAVVKQSKQFQECLHKILDVEIELYETRVLLLVEAEIGKNDAQDAYLSGLAESS